MHTNLAAAVETYLADLARIRASGGATGERSSYGPLANLRRVRQKACAFEGNQTRWRSVGPAFYCG